MRIYQVDRTEESDDGKCGGCNWESQDLFALASSPEEAQEPKKPKISFLFRVQRHLDL